MKKSFLLLGTALFLQTANAQSFQKSSLVLTANYGLDIYSIEQKTRLYNVSNSTQSQTSTAGSTNYNFEGEFGLFKWLGVGLHFKLDNYITSKDSSGYKPTAIGFETGVLVNLHLIRATHFNLLVGGNFGFSTLTYNVDAFNDQVYGDGSWIDLHASARFYFGRFGFNLNFYKAFINYPSLTTNNSSWGLGESVITSWYATGTFGGTIGIQYRILN